MSNLNYARIRNSQKKSDCNIEPKTLDFSVPLDIHPSNPNSFPIGERTVFPSSTSAKIESSNLKNLFGENVHMDNLNYINDMLKSSLPGPLTKPQRKKKGKEKADDEVVIQAPISSPEKVIAPIHIPDDTFNAPLPSLVVLDNNSSILVVNTEDGANSGTDKLKVPKADEGKPKLNCERNMSSTLPKKEAEMYAECSQGEENDSIKRSMSVEDIRNPKPKTYGKSNYYIATEEPEVQPRELIDVRVASESGHNRSTKNDFSASLGQYIDYFQKNEAMQYRTFKMSQYFVHSRGVSNSQNSVQGQLQSQRSSQPTMNAEMEKMKSQIKKLKEKVHDLQLSNELLYKERKGWKRKHQDLLLRAETAESDLSKVLKKNKQYKDKLKYTEELLQREKFDNESNLLALKRVLANNISTVLEHRISHYMSNSHREDSPRDRKDSPRDRKQQKNVWPDARHMTSKGSVKEKEKKSASTHAGSTIHHAAHDYEESHNIKNRYHKSSLQDKMSPLLSHKEPSFSDDEELKGIHEKFGDLSQVEDLYEEFDDREKLGRRKRHQQLSQFSMRPSDLDTSSEPTDELHLQNYASQQRNSDKIQQIQYLQNKLARLIDKDDSFSHTNSQYGQPTAPAKNYESAATPKSHRTRGHTNSLYNYKSQQNNSWNTINFNRKVHETIPATELHSQPSIH